MQSETTDTVDGVRRKYARHITTEEAKEGSARDILL